MKVGRVRSHRGLWIFGIALLGIGLIVLDGLGMLERYPAGETLVRQMDRAFTQMGPYRAVLNLKGLGPVDVVGLNEWGDGRTELITALDNPPSVRSAERWSASEWAFCRLGTKQVQDVRWAHLPASNPLAHWQITGLPSALECVKAIAQARHPVVVGTRWSMGVRIWLLECDPSVPAIPGTSGGPLVGERWLVTLSEATHLPVRIQPAEPERQNSSGVGISSITSDPSFDARRWREYAKVPPSFVAGQTVVCDAASPEQLGKIIDQSRIRPVRGTNVYHR